MRWAMIAGGWALMLLGGVWIFQGAGVLKGSFMTGQSRWLWIGIVCVAVGPLSLVGALRTTRRHGGSRTPRR